MSKGDLRRRAYDFLTQHWVIAAIVLSIPSELYAVIQIAGQKLGLTDKGQLTFLGNLIFWPALAVSFGIVLYKSRADKYDDLAKGDAQFVLERVLDGVNAATAKKLARFSEYIESHRTNKEADPFLEITQPKAQIEHILENIQVALAEIAGISRSNIGISLIFRLGSAAEWKWFHTVNIEHDLSLEMLVGDSRTSVRQIIDGRASAIFFADKRVGAKQQKYLPGPRDETCGGIGSILCRDISIGNRECLQAILSVTTYVNVLCGVHDRHTQQAIETSVMPSFESRLRLELSLYFIRTCLVREPTSIDTA